MSLSTLETQAKTLLADLKAKAVTEEQKAAAELVVLKTETFSLKVVVVVAAVALFVGAVVGHLV